MSDPAKFDARTAGKPDSKNVPPLARSAALSIINGAGLGNVGLVEGMGDPRLAYNLPPPSFAAPSAPAQQAGGTGGSDAAGATKATTGGGKTYADKEELFNAIVRNSGVAGAAGLTLDDIKDRDLEAANEKNVSLEEIAERIIEHQAEYADEEAEPTGDAAAKPAGPPAAAPAPPPGVTGRVWPTEIA